MVGRTTTPNPNSNSNSKTAPYWSWSPCLEDVCAAHTGVSDTVAVVGFGSALSERSESKGSWDLGLSFEAVC